MPKRTGGIGTWFCTAHPDAGRGGDDAVECAMFGLSPGPTAPGRPLAGGSGRLIRCGSLAGDPAPLFRTARVARSPPPLVRGSIGLSLLILLMLELVALSPPTGAAAREWAATRPILAPLAPCLVVAGIPGIRTLRPRTREERDTGDSGDSISGRRPTRGRCPGRSRPAPGPAPRGRRADRPRRRTRRPARS